VPVAPGRFSTTTCCPSDSDTIGASSRDSVSIEPPAPNGMITLMGLLGQGSLACAPAGVTDVAAMPPAVAASRLRLVIRWVIARPQERWMGMR
jgi:hypothetical protein